ncbi:MAG: lipoprotein-releasing system ATP-binding protein [Reinekea sp.]|jgi:lipoprotein-releasing system ATP-binding protein|uniref:ABC transporter ATP-binding protein n=2 Tax=Reinekea sp. TaxID=1970455 RepID=UPI00398A29B1
MNPNSVLSCQSVSRSFKLGHESIDVLKDISFDISVGEMASIVGTSGSGKTTLLNLLAGLDEPTVGDVLMAGQNLAKLADKDRARARNKHMGFVFQFHHLLPEFSALDNVIMPCRIVGKVTDESIEYGKSLLSSVGLGDRMRHRPGELSGGERQRVAIARALINKPAVVLMDEPTGNLDEDSSEQAQKLIESLNYQFKSSFVIVTHNQDWANHIPIQFKLSKGHLEKVS